MTPAEDDAPPGPDTELTVRLETEGGFGLFPGLSAPVELSTRDLDPGDGRQLRALVEAALRSQRPVAASSGATRPAGLADVRTYTLTVVAGGGPPVRLSARDPVPQGPVHALIRRLQDHRRARG